jgi:ADP-heptose:LPS heptosyltransferase
VDLLAHLQDTHQLPVLLTGLSEESPFLEGIAGKAEKRGIACQRWIGSREDPGSLLGLIRHSCLYLGTDSGPMHLAAALDVPVVALFGGGTWPRFLPLARRSFVATQQVPCFGCNWDCWLDEPVCIRKVPVQKFQDALDWILGSAKDRCRVDRGEKPERFSEEIIQRAIPQTRVTIQGLRAHSHASYVEGAARLRVIDEITAKLEASEADRKARLEEILTLQRQIRELATPRASLKRVIAAVVRRLRRFPFLKKHQQRQDQI